MHATIAESIDVPEQSENPLKDAGAATMHAQADLGDILLCYRRIGIDS
jgi:hypothetical protein